MIRDEVETPIIVVVQLVQPKDAATAVASPHSRRYGFSRATKRLGGRRSDRLRKRAGEGPFRRNSSTWWENGSSPRPHVPDFREVHRRPGPPGLGRIIDSETTLKPGASAVLALRKDLAPKITTEPCVIADAAPIAPAWMGEDGSPVFQTVRPERIVPIVETAQELVSRPVPDPIHGNPC